MSADATLVNSEGLAPPRYRRHHRGHTRRGRTNRRCEQMGRPSVVCLRDIAIFQLTRQQAP